MGDTPTAGRDLERFLWDAFSLVDGIDGERRIGEIAGDKPRDVCRALFERLWWHDQVVFDASR